MLRRLLSSQLATFSICRSALKPLRFPDVEVSSSYASSRPPTALFNHHFSTESGGVATTRKVEDVMPIAIGHEREELEAELSGRDILAMNYPVGPFGTKESPAIIKSYYDRRIVGCPGGEGEDEYDVVWFWLEKGKPHECTVCSQYFELFGRICRREAVKRLGKGEETLGEIEQPLHHSDTIDFMQTTFVSMIHGWKEWEQGTSSLHYEFSHDPS